jgi:c-di-GMP-binding flagellar brake protein YcgR
MLWRPHASSDPRAEATPASMPEPTMDAPEYADQWQRIAGDSQVLLRSQIEIAAVLQSLIDGDLPLVSHHQVHDQLFISRLLRIGAEQNFIVVGYSDNKQANAEVFAAGSVLFFSSHSRGYASFLASHPAEFDEGLPAIRFDFPQELLIEQRRVIKRVRVAPPRKLHCLADDGGIMPFEAGIVDVSLSGLGVMVYDPSIRLSPGTVLSRCCVDLPDGSVVSVDIEVMHAIDVVLQDGSHACRAGCRFVGDTQRVDKLLRFFVLDLERRESESSPAGPAA